MGEAHILFKNTGDGVFEDQTQENRLGRLSLRFHRLGNQIPRF